MALVYLATNRVNGKQYVGFTERAFAKRRKEHETQARLLGCRAFHGALLKYGVRSFVWEVLATGDKKTMLAEECRLIARLETLGPAGYNLTTGGESAAMGPEGKAKLSASMSGDANPSKRADVRAKNSASKKAWMAEPGVTERMTALMRTPEAMANMRASKKTPEFRALMRKQATATARLKQDPELGAQALTLREQGMSQAAVAVRLGIAQATVSCIERGINGWGELMLEYVKFECEQQFWLAYDAQVAAE